TRTSSSGATRPSPAAKVSASRHREPGLFSELFVIPAAVVGCVKLAAPFRKLIVDNHITSSKLQVQQRRTSVARLYLQQRTQDEIARELGVNQGTISRDLKAIQAEWQRQRLDDFQQAKLRELARIDQVEREYWQARERSCHDREQTDQEKTSAPTGDRLKAGTRSEGRDGTPEFLRGVERCIEMRCKILNLCVLKVNATGRLQVTHDLSRLSDEELHALETIHSRLTG